MDGLCHVSNHCNLSNVSYPPRNVSLWLPDCSDKKEVYFLHDTLLEGHWRNLQRYMESGDLFMIKLSIILEPNSEPPSHYGKS